MRLRSVAVAALLAPALVFARFDASVDTTRLSAGDTLRLTLRADSANPSGDPDLDPLSSSFDVLSDQRSSQFRMINGQTDAWTTWTLVLKPKRTGALDIPAISLGDEKSRPIRITVEELDPRVQQAISQTVFFETTYEPQQVYVQSQVVVSRKLFYVNGAQLYGDMPSVPDVAGAMVKPLGEAEHTVEMRDGRQYGVIAQRFAVFPERSGDLAIPGATVAGSVRVDSDFGGGRRLGIDVTAPALTIPVQPIPDVYPRGAAWLPATDVEVLQDWPGEPEQGLVTGTPSQRTLIVRVDGNAASVIPPLDTAPPESLQVYPEPAKLGETATRAGIVGTRTESYSLVATQPGELVMPEVRLVWWDIEHREVRVATLPPQTLRVGGAALATPHGSPPAVTQPAVVAPSIVVAAPAGKPATFPTDARWLAAAGAAAAGIAIFIWVRRVRHRASADGHNDEPRAYAEVARACAGRDPHRIRAALDVWLTARYTMPIAAATRAFATDAAARAALNALNARLYQSCADAPFDPSALRRSIDASRKSSAVTTDELPALYPSA